MSAWSSVPIVEAIKDVSGGNFKTQQASYERHGLLPIVDQGSRLIGGYTSNHLAAFAGDLPVIVFGDHTKNVKYVDFRFGMGADGVKVLAPRDGWHPRFVYHYLKQLRLPNAGYSRHYKFLKECAIPKPPVDEQARIAELLDRADALRAKRHEAFGLIDDLVQAVFIQMFGDLVGNDRHWPVSRVADFVAGFESGKSLVADDEDDQRSLYRVLKVSAVTSLRFRAQESKAVPVDYEPPTAHVVREGDLLFSRANTTELVGATALATDVPPNLLLSDKLWRFVWPAIPRSDPLFVRQLFQQPEFRREIGRRATGTSGSMKNVSQAKVLSIHLGLPPLDAQMTFASRVAAVDEMRRTVEMQSPTFDALFCSLQDRAFRGEL